MYTAITVSRQCGSGGREIGRLLAEGLGIPFYDKDLLRDFAVENGPGKMLLETYGEKRASSLLYSLATSAYSFGYHDPSQSIPISQKAYLVAFDTIREVAKMGPCVIVGRCADYALRDWGQCLSVFIHAPFDLRVKRVQSYLDISREEAEEKVRQTDRLRRNYYNYYTTKGWGEVDSYHLTVDSGQMGIENTASFLEKICLGLGLDIPKGEQAVAKGCVSTH